MSWRARDDNLANADLPRAAAEGADYATLSPIRAAMIAPMPASVVLRLLMLWLQWQHAARDELSVV